MYRSTISYFLILLICFVILPQKSHCQSNIFEKITVDELARNLLKIDYEKSKYETSEQYRKRMQDAFLHNGISIEINDYQNFITTKYNADKELYEIEFKAEKFNFYFPNNPSNMLKNKLVINFKTKINKVSSYLGENAFGAKREITYSFIDKYFLIVNNTYDLKLKLKMKDSLGDLKNGNIPINLPPKEAQSLDENLTLIIGCTILKKNSQNIPFLLRGSKTIPPTIDKPFAFNIKSYGALVKVNQLQIVNKKTNKVYLTIDTSKWP